MMFQKIPHKERMRHIKYREEQWERWERDEEKREQEVIRQMIAEKERYIRQNEPMNDKERDAMEDMKRLMQFVEEKANGK